MTGRTQSNFLAAQLKIFFPKIWLGQSKIPKWHATVALKIREKQLPYENWTNLGGAGEKEKWVQGSTINTLTHLYLYIQMTVSHMYTQMEVHYLNISHTKT